MCTINAMANSGVARLTIGIDTNSAISSAGDEHRAAVRTAHRLGFLRRAEAHGGEQEIFAAEQIGGGEEHHHEAEAGEQQERHRAEIDEDAQQRGLECLR